MVVCTSCDLVSRAPRLRPGERDVCPGCREILAKLSRSPIEGTLALALYAAMLLVLSNLYPFLLLSMEGQVQASRIITGVIGLWLAGQAGLAMLILFTTVLAPALRLLGLLYVLTPVSLGRMPPAAAPVLRLQETPVSWTMLDAYMLALLVALVKLAQMAKVQLELGAYGFVALFVVLSLTNALYDSAALWDRVKALR